MPMEMNNPPPHDARARNLSPHTATHSREARAAGIENLRTRPDLEVIPFSGETTCVGLPGGKVPGADQSQEKKKLQFLP